MSIVVGAITKQGLAISADSREIRKDGSVSDDARKVLTGNNVVIGFAGMLETTVKGRTIRTEDILRRMIVDDKWKSPTEFGRKLFAEMIDAFTQNTDDRIDLLVGTRINGSPEMILTSITQLRCEEHFVKDPCIIACGEYDFVPTLAISRTHDFENMDSAELAKLTEMLAKDAKAKMEEYERNGLVDKCTIGGDIVTGSLP